MDFITCKEAAERWGVSERSARNYCAQGRVPGAVRRGGVWQVPAGAVKPPRARGGAAGRSPLLQRLLEERGAGVRGGIYHKLQVELTYNSNHMEGSRLSMEQTRHIFETSTVGAEGGALRVDDIVETVNHFRCIDYCLDHAGEPLSEHFVKELHRILKSGTTDSALSWFAVGEYKRLPNEVGGRSTAEPEDVEAELRALLQAYVPARGHGFEEIVDFHVGFERVHPFQDGNGRVGRLVMLKECLASGVVPFVIADDMKLFYYRGLAEWERERGCLLDTCLAAQDRFKAWLDYFRIAYE